MIAVIGGTGVYNPELLKNAEEREISTPYGKPSEKIVLGNFRGKKVAVLARHGFKHSIAPHKINHKANIFALHSLGVDRIIATAAVGSLKEEFRAGDIVVPNQFLDFGKEVQTFYEQEKVVHVSLAEPFCPELNKLIAQAARQQKYKVHENCTYLRISGPQFGTKAASNFYRQFADIIGMTCVPEAILAREKQICYSVIATVTDYDCWRKTEEAVSIDAIFKVMKENLEKTRRVLEETIPEIPEKRTCACSHALKGAEV